MALQDFYKTLGVDSRASAEEIKRAFRKLARKYHPDVSKEKDAEARFKEVNQAYETLGDAEKRAEYDALRANPWQGRRRPQGSAFETGPSPEFEANFADQFGGGNFEEFIRRAFGQGTQHTGARHEASQFRLALTLEEAFHGTTQEISLPHKKIRLKVPAGVAPGQVIRADEIGIEIQIAPHPLYAVAGRDLLLTVPITPFEAVLGAKLRVPTMAGFVEVKVPPGQQPGARLRLKGRGLPKGPHWDAGDQYLVFKVIVPTQLSSAEKHAYEEVAKHSHQQLREGWR